MRTYLTQEDIEKILGVKKTKAYEVIKQLNADLEAKGYLTVKGKVSAKYFMEKYYCNEEEVMRCLEQQSKQPA